jgi:hypothetical protein
MSQWRWAITIIIALLTITFVSIAALDISFELHGQRPIGERIQTWSRRYPLFSVALVALFGAMLAHFFLNHGW